MCPSDRIDSIVDCRPARERIRCVWNRLDFYLNLAPVQCESDYTWFHRPKLSSFYSGRQKKNSFSYSVKAKKPFTKIGCTNGCNWWNWCDWWLISVTIERILKYVFAGIWCRRRTLESIPRRRWYGWFVVWWGWNWHLFKLSIFHGSHHVRHGLRNRWRIPLNNHIWWNASVRT